MAGLGVDVLEKPATGARNKRNRVTVGAHDAIAKKLKIAEDKLNDERASHAKTKLALVTAELGLKALVASSDVKIKTLTQQLETNASLARSEMATKLAEMQKSHGDAIMTAMMKGHKLATDAARPM